MKTRWAIIGMAAALLVGGAAGAGAMRMIARHEQKLMVNIDQAPAAVKTTLQREAGDGKIVEIIRESRRGRVSYEATATIGEHGYEIRVAEDGTLISKEMREEKKH